MQSVSTRHTDGKDRVTPPSPSHGSITFNPGHPLPLAGQSTPGQGLCSALAGRPVSEHFLHTQLLYLMHVCSFYITCSWGDPDNDNQECRDLVPAEASLCMAGELTWLFPLKRGEAQGPPRSGSQTLGPSTPWRQTQGSQLTKSTGPDTERSREQSTPAPKLLDPIPLAFPFPGEPLDLWPWGTIPTPLSHGQDHSFPAWKAYLERRQCRQQTC